MSEWTYDETYDAFYRRTADVVGIVEAINVAAALNGLEARLQQAEAERDSTARKNELLIQTVEAIRAERDRMKEALEDILAPSPFSTTTQIIAEHRRIARAALDAAQPAEQS